MQIYKTFMKISFRNIGTCIGYLVMLIIFSSAISKSESSFNETKIKVAVVDHDKSALSETLYNYIDKNHSIKNIGDKDEWSDYIYYHEVEYILVINEGFGENMLSGSKDNLLTSYQAPDSNSSYIVESRINAFVNNVKLYISSGCDLETACKKAEEIGNIASEVIFSNDEQGENFSAMHFFFNFVPYIMIVIFMQCIGLLILIFNKPDLKERTAVSGLSFARQNIEFISAIITYMLGIYVVFMCMASVLHKDELFSRKGLYYSINVMIYMFVCISITFLISQFCKKVSALSVCSNIIGLSTSFLCGVFVQRDVLPAKVVSISKLIPTYWYIDVDEEIKKIKGPLTSRAWHSMFIQILFAIAIMSVGLALKKMQQQKSE